MKNPSHLTIQRVPPEQAPMDLLLEADPSEKQVERYLTKSYCYVAVDSEEIVGVYVLSHLNETALELMNIAVRPGLQGRGIGSKMLKHAIDSAKKMGAERLELGTGTFGYQLAFYQKAGFRVCEVERDYFLNYYDEPIFEDGIRHKDRLRLAIDFS